jgi:hypothetical protein
VPGVTRLVGRYEAFEELGRGGMARVYLARQIDLDRLVALKELSAFHASDPSFAERFLRESRLAGSLSHPNIVTVHEYFEHEGTPYIAMEYLARGSLRPYVGRLSLAQAIGVLEGVLAGLTHAETRGIVHRDIKPENVLVSDEGRVKIADFGLAKAAMTATGQFMTASGTAVGTPAYMAPEQVLGEDVGPWTDLYSLGVMSYELLVGRRPYPDSELAVAAMMKHIREPIPPPRSINPDLDEHLAHWLERLLEKSPEQRARSAAPAWDELEETVIRICGPRWRREARLPEQAASAEALRPLTPAPFEEPPPAPPLQPRAPTTRRSPAVATPAPAAATTYKPVGEAPSPRRRIATVPLLVLGALLAAAGVAGWLVAPSSEKSAANAPALASSASNAALQVRFPARWRQTDAGPPIDGLKLADPVALAGAQRDAAIVAGTSDATGPTLLPKALLRRLPGQPHATAVKLGPLAAYRYGPVTASSPRQRLIVYAIPTTIGVVTLACLDGAASAHGGCETIATTLRLRGARAYPLGPSPAYAKALGAGIHRLDGERARDRDALTVARTRPGQSHVARALGDAYRVAAQALRTQSVSPADRPANDRIVTALAATAHAYDGLAAAARRGDKDAYAKAAKAVAEGEQRVEAAMAALGRLGYAVT